MPGLVPGIHVFFLRKTKDVDGRDEPGHDENAESLSSAVGGHEDRQRKIGEVMQRLVDPDQRPEPGMLQRHAKIRRDESLGAIDRDVDDEIDKRDEPEFRRDDQDHHQCNRKVYQAVGQQRQRPAGLLVLAKRHPGILQDKIRDDVLDGESECPSDKRAYRNGR